MGGLDAGPAGTGNALIDFILKQLAPAEQVGFLRGSIIWISARMGTDAAIAGDALRLNDFNLAFQSHLRQLQIENEVAMSKQAQYIAQADADARKRGFENSTDMQATLNTLYLDVVARLKQWHTSTEPGGDPTNAPDIDRLLYDAWRITEGVKE